MAFPPFVAVTLGAVAAAAAARMVVNEWRRINAALHPHAPVPVKEARKTLPTLRRDPVTGIYRPDRRAER